MSLADIKSKIEADAVREATAHREKVQEQIDSITREANRQIDQIKAESAARLENEKKEVHRRRNIVAELDVRKEDLAARRVLIDNALQSALGVLSGIPSGRYSSFMEKLLEEAMETGDEILLLSKDEKVINKSWIDAFNQKHKSKLEIYDENVPISGGFILRKGRVDTNCSWEMLLDSLRIELEAEVVKRLFAE